MRELKRSRKFESEQMSRKESISGAANDGIADNIDIVIRNEYSLYKSMRAIVDSLVKKASKGVNLDKDKLAKSSVVDQLVRQAIRYLQREDHDGEQNHAQCRNGGCQKHPPKKHAPLHASTSNL